jgi:xanthosine utilization system XapX-like protein
MAYSERVLKLLPKLRKRAIDGKTYFVAEGDLLLDEAELEAYAKARSAAPTPPPRYELLGMLEGDKIVRWKIGLVLTYAVARKTFEKESYDTVVANMKAATSAWEDACGVKFEHRWDQDEADTPDVLFRVRGHDAGGAFIAAAFFPNDPPERRVLYVDPSYFKSWFDPVGVFRHELGHVLGFRHEHIRKGAPPDCPSEDTTGTTGLSEEYDPQSVMHYFCGGVGSKELALTDKDEASAQRVYGPPLHRVKYFE